MNFLKQNIGLIYFILPYIQVVENKFGLVSSLFFGRKNYQIKLKDNISITFPSSKFSRMMDLLGILTFSSYFSKKDDQIEFSFDTKNKFSVPLKNLSYEDENLLELFFGSIKHGANFILLAIFLYFQIVLTYHLPWPLLLVLQNMVDYRRNW